MNLVSIIEILTKIATFLTPSIISLNHVSKCHLAIATPPPSGTDRKKGHRLFLRMFEGSEKSLGFHTAYNDAYFGAVFGDRLMGPFYFLIASLASAFWLLQIPRWLRTLVRPLSSRLSGFLNLNSLFLRLIGLEARKSELRSRQWTRHRCQIA